MFLQLSNEHGSQVKDQGRRQCYHNKHKNFPIGLHVMYLYFPDKPRILWGFFRLNFAVATEGIIMERWYEIWK